MTCTETIFLRESFPSKIIVFPDFQLSFIVYFFLLLILMSPPRKSSFPRYTERPSPSSFDQIKQTFAPGSPRSRLGARRSRSTRTRARAYALRNFLSSSLTLHVADHSVISFCVFSYSISVSRFLQQKCTCISPCTLSNSPTPISLQICTQTLRPPFTQRPPARTHLFSSCIKRRRHLQAFLISTGTHCTELI